MNFVLDMYANIETVANIETIMESQSDYDADRQKPALSMDEMAEYDDDYTTFDIGENPGEHTHFRRLEDIHKAFLCQYLGNVMYRLSRETNAGGFLSYNNQHKELNSISFESDDDEDFIEAADARDMALEVDYTPEQIDEALHKLNFTLKRLKMLSSYCKIHTISFFMEFILARDKYEAEKLSSPTMTRSFSHNDVLRRNKAYASDKYGNPCNYMTVSSKLEKVKFLFDWIIRADYTLNRYKGFYQDYLDFAHELQVLNIDIEHTDARIFNAEFVDSLICYNLTPDKQYNNEVYTALQENYVEIQDAQNYISETQITFTSMMNLNKSLQTWQYNLDTNKLQKFRGEIIDIFKAYRDMRGYPCDESLITFHQGFMYYNGSITGVTASFVCNRNRPSKTIDLCLLHEIGYCIVCTTRTTLPVLKSIDALNNINNRRTQNIDELDTTWTILTL